MGGQTFEAAGDSAGSPEDGGLLTKEQERELRMYVTQPGRLSEVSTQQETLQSVRRMLNPLQEAQKI